MHDRCTYMKIFSQSYLPQAFILYVMSIESPFSLPLLPPHKLESLAQKIKEFAKEKTALIKFKKRKLSEIQSEIQPARDLEHKRHNEEIVKIEEQGKTTT